MDIPAARGAARQTLSPGERADPGLVSVRGLDWLGPNRRREGCIHVHQTYRYAARSAEDRDQGEFNRSRFQPVDHAARRRDEIASLAIGERFC